MTCGDRDGHKRLHIRILRKTLFFSQFLSWRLHVKTLKNGQQYANSVAPLPCSSDALPVTLRYVINVIFGKTAITRICKAKDFNKKLKLSRTSYRVSQILKSAYFYAEIGKKALNTVTMVTKNIDMLYLSNGAR